MENANANETNYKKAKYYCVNEIIVHISLDKNVNKYAFYNGLILEVKNDFITLLENKLGRIVVFFSEIFSIDQFTREVKR